MLGVTMLTLSSPSDDFLASFVAVSSELPAPALLFLLVESLPLPLGSSIYDEKIIVDELDRVL